MNTPVLLLIMCGHLGLNLIGLHGFPALLPDLFVNDFMLLAVAIVAATPLVLLLRRPGRGVGE